ncbi:MAG: L,D-transpeptidase family protein [Alphaproteobacteria bacterium]|nr:L,D-transpeptidase family protein [Alphaproteobacteria bacterium]
MLVGSMMALGLGVFGLAPCSLRALAVEPGEDASTAGPAVSEPNVGSPNVIPFLGNPELKARLDPPGKLTVGGERMHDRLLRRFYAVHGYQTVWDSHAAAARRLWDTILRADEQGLDPNLFHSATLAGRSAALSPVERDLLLSDAFLSYADALSRGAMPIEDRADDEDLRPEPLDVVAMLDAAIASPDPPKLIEALAPSSTEYLTLRRAYAEYRAGAEPGSTRASEGGASAERRTAAGRRARQLAVNLERLRWLPRLIPSDRVVVNSAIARLQLFRNDRPVFTTRVVVGETDKQTPEFYSTIGDVLFNPPWNIPRSIAQKEILPRLAADPDYLSSHHMRWRAGGSIQQEAGPYSALGRLKFEMTDRYDVYLHDTPTKSLFQSADRMMSHGCVRVENPRVLAQLLLGQSPEAIDKGISRGYTNRRALPTPLPIFIVYQTVYVESDGSIQFRSDPYERDDEIWQRLTRAQQPPLAQDSAVGQRKG